MALDDSYVTLEEAMSYLARRLRTDAWDRADTAMRTRALTHAVLILESLSWIGDKSDPDQPLAWPRDGDTEIPQPIKAAQCELALALLVEPVRHVVTTKAEM